MTEAQKKQADTYNKTGGGEAVRGKRSGAPGYGGSPPRLICFLAPYLNYKLGAARKEEGRGKMGGEWTRGGLSPLFCLATMTITGEKEE